MLSRWLEYWHGILGLDIIDKDEKVGKAKLAYASKHAHVLELEQIESVNHAEAFGRIAFSCPKDKYDFLSTTCTSAILPVHRCFVFCSVIISWQLTPSDAVKAS